jgi:hypothetical protein
MSAWAFHGLACKHWGTLPQRLAAAPASLIKRAPLRSLGLGSFRSYTWLERVPGAIPAPAWAWGSSGAPSRSPWESLPFLLLLIEKTVHCSPPSTNLKNLNRIDPWKKIAMDQFDFSDWSKTRSSVPSWQRSLPSDPQARGRSAAGAERPCHPDMLSTAMRSSTCAPHHASAHRAMASARAAQSPGRAGPGRCPAPRPARPHAWPTPPCRRRR